MLPNARTQCRHEDHLKVKLLSLLCRKREILMSNKSCYISNEEINGNLKLLRNNELEDTFDIVAPT